MWAKVSSLWHLVITLVHDGVVDVISFWCKVADLDGRITDIRMITVRDLIALV